MPFIFTQLKSFQYKFQTLDIAWKQTDLIKKTQCFLDTKAKLKRISKCPIQYST